jgi:hypothetical protein
MKDVARTINAHNHYTAPRPSGRYTARAHYTTAFADPCDEPELTCKTISVVMRGICRKTVLERPPLNGGIGVITQSAELYLDHYCPDGQFAVWLYRESEARPAGRLQSGDSNSSDGVITMARCHPSHRERVHGRAPSLVS